MKIVSFFKSLFKKISDNDEVILKFIDIIFKAIKAARKLYTAMNS